MPHVSFTVNVNNVVLVPSAVTLVGLADNVDVELAAAPAVKVTVVDLLTDATVADTALVSAVVDASVVLNTPAPLVDPDVCAKMLLDPELLNDTAWPGTGLPCASTTVRVMVLVLVPLAVTLAGLATMVVVAAAGAPAVKVTDAFFVADPAIAVTVFTWAVVDAKEAMNTPDAFVVPDDAGDQLLLSPELLNETLCPETGLPLTSCAVTVNVL